MERTSYFNSLAAILAPVLAQAQISVAQKDALLKEASRAVQEALSATHQHNLEWFQTMGEGNDKRGMGYPTTIGFDPVTRGVHMGIQEVLDVLGDRGHLTEKGKRELEKLQNRNIRPRKPKTQRDYDKESSHGRGGARPSDYNQPKGFTRTRP